MKQESTFAYSSYKSVMKARLRGEGNRGELSRAAESLNCQRSFLSRIMNSKLQLTPDLAFKLSLYWKLPLAEREYFQALVEMDRAGDPTYLSHLKDKVANLRDTQASLSKRSNRPAPSGEHDLLYFSAWYWTAIHFLTSIPELQSADAIAMRLGLPKQLVSDCLEQLRDWGFVEKFGARWEYKGGEFHLPKDSPLVILHHQNWRARAVLNAQAGSTESLHFTNVHTVSRKNLPLLKERLLKFIAETNDLLKEDQPEKCVAFLCDLFSAG